jgi:hypothetical protein
MQLHTEQKHQLRIMEPFNPQSTRPRRIKAHAEKHNLPHHSHNKVAVIQVILVMLPKVSLPSPYTLYIISCRIPCQKTGTQFTAIYSTRTLDCLREGQSHRIYMYVCTLCFTNKMTKIINCENNYTFMFSTLPCELRFRFSPHFVYSWKDNNNKTSTVNFDCGQQTTNQQHTCFEIHNLHTRT